MAVTFAFGNELSYEVYGLHRVWIGGMVATGLYSTGGSAIDISTVTRGKLNSAILVESIGLAVLSDLSGAFFAHYIKQGGVWKAVLFTASVHAHDFTTDSGGEIATAHTHDLKLIAGVTEDEGIGIETTGGPIIGTATGQTVTGADAATKGGVLSGGEVVTAHTHTGTTDSVAGGDLPLVQVPSETDVSTYVLTMRIVGN